MFKYIALIYLITLKISSKNKADNSSFNPNLITVLFYHSFNEHKICYLKMKLLKISLLLTVIVPSICLFQNPWNKSSKNFFKPEVSPVIYSKLN